MTQESSRFYLVLKPNRISVFEDIFYQCDLHGLLVLLEDTEPKDILGLFTDFDEANDCAVHSLLKSIGHELQFDTDHPAYIIPKAIQRVTATLATLESVSVKLNRSYYEMIKAKSGNDLDELSDIIRGFFDNTNRLRVFIEKQQVEDAE
jgi:hypothetical protein